MSKVLDQVQLPDSRDGGLSNEAEMELAKIKILQSTLRLAEQRILQTLSEESAKEVNDYVQHIHGLEPERKPRVPEFLTVRDVSRLTGLVPQVVRRHCAKQTFKSEQVAGENSSWRIFPEQFMGYSNWNKFLGEREAELESSKRIVNLAINLWDGDGPVDITAEGE